VAGRRYGDGQSQVWGDLIGPNPTDRAKPGTKKSVLVEADGGPLSVVVAGANIHDTKLLAATVEAIIVPRPGLTADAPQHLCLDKAYDNPTGRQTVAAFHYVPHIRRIGEDRWGPEHPRQYPARRWVVERTLAWLGKCRAILVRYDKHGGNYLGLIQFACSLLWYRRAHRLRVLG
jgi:putative transposase